ncbi:H-NS histone family protein [Roseomonas sp. NAR14]|uniref:H-NS histone family protein n=1 Tax=Roseomonas acroporae TaxID=2937791 RepID=A0A9X2BVJ5_9PROT|nr:H-NS histone family protein [Roseomonas acroporae]MCK8786762.1 H-NS histone family protein [Roseomonas acroporae]
MATKQTIDLDSMTAEELRALITAAEAKFAEKREDALQALKTEMEERAKQLGLSVGDLFGYAPPESHDSARGGRKPRKDAGKTIEPKYRGPNGEEWTGRGRKPKWLMAAEADGKDPEQFRIAA